MKMKVTKSCERITWWKEERRRHLFQMIVRRINMYRSRNFNSLDFNFLSTLRNKILTIALVCVTFLRDKRNSRTVRRINRWQTLSNLLKILQTKLHCQLSKQRTSLHFSKTTINQRVREETSDALDAQLNTIWLNRDSFDSNHEDEESYEWDVQLEKI